MPRTPISRVSAQHPLIVPDAPSRRTLPSRALLIGRIGSLIVMVFYAWVRLSTPDWWDLLDDVDLAVHEAGHIVFQPFGDTMTALGGSLLQVVVPLAFVVYFMRSRQRFSGAISLAWVGVNLLSVARYASDARAQQLDLLGGDNAIHDWWYILISFDALDHDLMIGRAIRGLGVLVFAAALAIGAWVIRDARADDTV